MGHLIHITDVLPTTSYLATQYWDKTRNFITRRVYYENGEVKAFNGKEWWLVCVFNLDQVERAKMAIKTSGLASAKDLNNSQIHDTAPLSFAWKIEEDAGIVTNWCYPATDHPVLEQLELALDDLENERVIKNER